MSSVASASAVAVAAVCGASIGLLPCAERNAFLRADDQGGARRCTHQAMATDETNSTRPLGGNTAKLKSCTVGHTAQFAVRVMSAYRVFVFLCERDVTNNCALRA